MSRLTTVTIPAERQLQLHAIADALGVKHSQAVEALINLAVENGIIPDRLPGFDLTPLPGAVLFSTLTFALPPLSTVEARNLAKVLDGAANKSPLDHPLSFKDRDGRLVVLSRGNGVVLLFAKGDENKHATLTRGMARDLARQLRTAASKADSFAQ